MLVVYIIDLKEVYNSPELIEKSKKEQINLDIPIIGFALGIPPLSTNLGGNYLINKHIKDNILNNPEPDEDNDDWDDEDLEGIISESYD